MIPRSAVVTALLVAMPAITRAHDGPPFPIVSDRLAGPYRLSIWTDPDATDDGSAGGQFWVRVTSERTRLPNGTRVSVAVRPLERAGHELTAQAIPVRGDITNQFAALVMDHEGRFAVRVTIAGPLGDAGAEAQVDATYNLRPAPVMVMLYAAPFLIVGILWGALLVRRRRTFRGPSNRRPAVDPRM